MGALTAYFKRSRRKLEDRLSSGGRPERLSLLRYVLHEHLTRSIDSYASGVCLDVGSGHSPFRQRLATRGSKVISVDVEDRAGLVDVIADVQDMAPIGDQSADTVLCSQVLEHVPHPAEALGEIERVLRPGGHAILSVPHLSAIHEAPHDYFRFTEYGLRTLLPEQGLEILELRTAGGWIAFLGHYLSLLFLCSLTPVPVIGSLSLLLNELLMVRLLRPIDRVLGAPGLFTCNYVVVARKAGSAPEPFS